MKILLVNTVDVKSPVEVMFPPLGLAYIASSLRKRFPAIELKVVYGDVEGELDSFRPDILGISSVTQNYNHAKEYARAAKARGIPALIGGTHITSIPSTMTADMDIAVLGEGEETVVELVERFYGSGNDINACKGVSGTAWREDGRVRTAPARKPITPLDGVPLPARDLLPIPRRGIVHLFSSRGCPYRCRFCASARFWDKVRFFSADYVMEEIARVVEDFDPITVGFYDDLFIASKKRFFEVAERVIKEGYHRRLEFVLNGRANLITEEMATAMKRMNVVAVNLGIESGSPRTLRMLKDDTVSVEANMRAIETLRCHGINAHGTFIIGSPGETEAEIGETVSFIKRSRLSSFDVYILTPYPGTPLWSIALEKGLVSDDMDWSKLIQEPREVDPNKVLMADLVKPDALYRHYMGLLRAAKVRKFRSRIETAIRNPRRIISAIQRNIISRYMTGPSAGRHA